MRLSSHQTVRSLTSSLCSCAARARPPHPDQAALLHSPASLLPLLVPWGQSLPPPPPALLLLLPTPDCQVLPARPVPRPLPRSRPGQAVFLITAQTHPLISNKVSLTTRLESTGKTPGIWTLVYGLWTYSLD